jgi:ABC-2 type transport system permease protein
MNIFFRELAANRKSLIIWSIVVILLTIVGFSKFSAFYENPELLAVLDSMPPAVISALNMEAFNLTSVTGFYGMMMMYFGLILSIAAVMWGSDIISKEEREKTVEFSLTMPITRSRLLTAKFAAALLNCIVLLMVTGGISIVSAQPFQPGRDFYRFVMISMPAFFLNQLIFLALGIFLGSALKQYKKAGSISVSILLASYFMSIMFELSQKLKFLRYFAPLKYFDSVQLMQESSLDMNFVLLSLFIAAIFLFSAYLTYSKRDLYI